MYNSLTKGQSLSALSLITYIVTKNKLKFVEKWTDYKIIESMNLYAFLYFKTMLKCDVMSPNSNRYLLNLMLI